MSLKQQVCYILRYLLTLPADRAEVEEEEEEEGEVEGRKPGRQRANSS